MPPRARQPARRAAHRTLTLPRPWQPPPQWRAQLPQQPPPQPAKQHINLILAAGTDWRLLLPPCQKASSCIAPRLWRKCCHHNANNRAKSKLLYCYLSTTINPFLARSSSMRTCARCSALAASACACACAVRPLAEAAAASSSSARRAARRRLAPRSASTASAASCGQAHNSTMGLTL